jgi:hypothetical protein
MSHREERERVSPRFGSRGDHSGLTSAVEVIAT